MSVVIIFTARNGKAMDFKSYVGHMSMCQKQKGFSRHGITLSENNLH